MSKKIPSACSTEHLTFYINLCFATLRYLINCWISKVVILWNFVATASKLRLPNICQPSCECGYSIFVHIYDLVSLLPYLYHLLSIMFRFESFANFMGRLYIFYFFFYIQGSCSEITRFLVFFSSNIFDI